MNPTADVSYWLNSAQSHREFLGAQHDVKKLVKWVPDVDGGRVPIWTDSGEPAHFYAFGRVSADKHRFTPDGNATKKWTVTLEDFVSTKYTLSLEEPVLPADRVFASIWESQLANLRGICALDSVTKKDRNLLDKDAGAGGATRIAFSARIYEETQESTKAADDASDTSVSPREPPPIAPANHNDMWYDIASFPVSAEFRGLRDEAAESGNYAVLPVNVWRPTAGEHVRVPPLGQQGATRGALVKITFVIRHHTIKKEVDSFVGEIEEVFILRLGEPLQPSPRKRALLQGPIRPAPWTPSAIAPIRLKLPAANAESRSAHDVSAANANATSAFPVPAPPKTPPPTLVNTQQPPATPGPSSHPKKAGEAPTRLAKKKNNDVEKS